MARTVSVNITANTSGFTAGMGKVSSSAKTTADQIKASFGAGLNGLSKNSRSVNTLASGLGKLGIVAGVGIGAAVKSFADFDSAMSGVAATGSDAKANLEALRAAAIKAGADTKFSATEAAQGVEALSKAGVSAKDTLGGGLSGALDLAAAGNLGVADSAEVAASAMNQFGLSGAQVPHIADLLAQAAGTAQGEVSDMAAALNQSGLVAHQFGLSIDETAQSLALFAKNGLVGSDAGTSFKTMLTSLYAPAGTSAKALDKLGVSAYDAGGNMKPIGVLADDLKAKLDGLSEQDRNSALKNIFGSDALRAGTILLRDGSAGLSQMATDFGKFGSAADVARTKMDNLKGDLEQLKGSFETALIGLGEGANGPLRGLTEGLTGAVNKFNDLGSGTKGAILAVAGIGAASALGVAGVAKLAIGAADAYSAFSKLSANMPRLAGAMRGLGVAAGIAVGALIALRAAGAGINTLMGDNAKTTDQAAQAIAKLSDTAGQGSSSLDEFFAFTTEGDITVGTQNIDGLGQAFDRLENRGGLTKFNDGLTGLVSGMTGVKGTTEIITDRFGQMDDRLTQLSATSQPEAAKGFAEIAKAAAAQNVPVGNLVDLFPQYAAAVQSAADANGTKITSDQQLADLMASGLPAAAGAATDAIGKTGTALDGQAGAAKNAAANLSSYASALEGLHSSASSVEEAIDAGNAALKENGKTLNLNTAAGRANQAALDGLSAAAKTNASSMVKAGASQDAVNASGKRARDNYARLAQGMGLSKSAAHDLAVEMVKIPTSKNVRIVTEGAKVSKSDAVELNIELKKIPAEKRARIVTIAETKGAKAARAAMAQIKDKQVIASTKGELKGAKAVNAAMKALKDRLVLAKARGDKKGADLVRAAMNSLKSRIVTAGTRADVSGARAAQAAVNSVRGKTVYITVKKTQTTGGIPNDAATGGLITPAGTMFRGPLRRSNGGPVWGAGSATSDSIPALLSNGEFVIRAAAVKAIGVSALTSLNAKGYANGGAVKGYATGGGVDYPALARLLATNPSAFADITKAMSDIAKATKRGKKGLDDLKSATEALKSAQQAFADNLKQQSAALSDPFRSKSTDIDDWLESFREGTADLTTFKNQIAKLKQLGVSDSVLKAITDQGAVAGSELASQLIAGGKKLVDSVNKASTGLDKAADGVALKVGGVKGYASGGFISGAGTGVSDSITARVSNGEYVVNAAATAAHRGVLDAMNYGRRISSPQIVPHYAGGGYVQRPVSKSDYHAGDIYLQGVIGDPDRWLRKAQQAKRDTYTMAGLNGAI